MNAAILKEICPSERVEEENDLMLMEVMEVLHQQPQAFSFVTG